MRSAASILLLTSLLYASTPSFADNLSQDCGIFAINQFGFNNAQGFTLAAFEGSPADDTVTAIPLEIQPRFQLLSVSLTSQKPVVRWIKSSFIFSGN